MISLQDWRQQLVEFSGPIGQIDPNGQSPSQMPNVFPNSPIGSAQPGGMMNNVEAEMPSQLQTFMRVLKNKPAQQIIAIRNNFNQSVQQILASKSTSAARAGMMNNFAQARDMKTNFGKQPVSSY